MSNEELEYKVDIDVEKSEGTFRVDLVGEDTQESYKGVFKVKCLLNPMDFIAADKLYRELLGGKPVEAHKHASALSFALAQLKYRVTKMPPFWENRELPGGHIQDHNIIIEVLNRAIYCQQRYVDLKREEADRIEKELTDDILNGILAKMPELDNIEDSEIDLEEDQEMEDGSKD